MMHDKFRRARQDYLCAGCGKTIDKGTQYYHRHPNNYHNECLPKTETPIPVEETKMVEPTPEVKTDPAPQTQNPGTKPTRDAKGHFIKVEKNREFVNQTIDDVV